MNPEQVQWFTSLGIGGVLAAGMFYVYRKDAQEAQARIEHMASQITNLANRLFDVITNMQPTIASHNTLIEQLLQRLDKESKSKS